MKTCKICEVEKDESEFYFSNGYINHHCKSCNTKKAKEWCNNNREARKLSSSKYHYKKSYNLSIEEISAMFESQNGKCPVCNSLMILDGKRSNQQAVIDHCHETNDIRGMLCNLCNKGLGHFRDNAEFLSNAIKYLKGENY